MKRSSCADTDAQSAPTQGLYPAFPSTVAMLAAEVPTLATAAFNCSGVTRHLLHQPATSVGLVTSTWARSQAVSFLIVVFMIPLRWPGISGQVALYHCFRITSGPP